VARGKKNIYRFAEDKGKRGTGCRGPLERGENPWRLLGEKRLAPRSR